MAKREPPHIPQHCYYIYMYLLTYIHHTYVRTYHEAQNDARSFSNPRAAP